jgi:hypothetical protein
VQFTRQTPRPGRRAEEARGVAEGSKLGNSDAEEVSHMLFGRA